MPQLPRGEFPNFPKFKGKSFIRLERRSPMKTILTVFIIWFLLVVALIVGGGFCTDYVIDVAFGKDLPFIADVGIGLVTAEIAIPVALGCWIAVECDAETPFFNRPEPQPTTVPTNLRHAAE